MADQGIYNVDEAEDELDYESDGSDEDSDQDVATLNSVLQKLRIKPIKGILNYGESLNTRMTRERIGQIVAKIGSTTTPDAIDVAFRAVVAKEAQAVAKQPRDLAAEYRAASAIPPNPPRTVTGGLRDTYVKFLTTRDGVRTMLGISNANANQWVVAWVDAGDNAKKLAAYLDIACQPIESVKGKGFKGILIYGHTSFGLLPYSNGRPNARDPRMGQSKYYTPSEVHAFIGTPDHVVVIGCDSKTFAGELENLLHRQDIICTERPFHWHKAGQCPEFIVAENSATQEIYGTLIDILFQ
jgi:hypothetical protein